MSEQVYQIRYQRRKDGEWSVWHSFQPYELRDGMTIREHAIAHAREYPESGLGIAAEVRWLTVDGTFSTNESQPDLFSMTGT